jgi:hypothetical protein
VKQSGNALMIYDQTFPFRSGSPVGPPRYSINPFDGPSRGGQGRKRVTRASRRGFFSKIEREEGSWMRSGWRWRCGEMGREGEVERSKFESSVTSLLLADWQRGREFNHAKTRTIRYFLAWAFIPVLSSFSLMYFFSSSSRGPFRPFGIDLGLHQRYCN